MATRFIVLGMKRFKESNELEVTLMIGQERTCRLKFEGIGATIPGELENLMTQRTERSQDFIELAFSFYEGNNVEFPIDLS